MNTQFLKNNYEKVILLIVLILFIFSLYWLIDVVSDSKKQRETGTSIAINNMKYKKINPESIDYKQILLDYSELWKVSSKRETNKNSETYILPFTDFMIPFRIARSNAVNSEGILIPYVYYEYGYDPVTKEKITLVAEDTISTSIDTDSDGIPDYLEKLYGLNPANPKDAAYDKDNDSFSNLQEYKFNPEGINDASIHPPFISRLVLENIEETKIPLTVKKIVRSGKNHDDWTIQVNLTLGDKTKTRFLKIGNTIDLNGLVYRITGIEDDLIEHLNPKLNAFVKRDVSKVLLENSSGEVIKAKLNEPVYEPSRLATFKDVFDDKLIKLRLNNTIELGSQKLGFEKYKLVAIADDNNMAEFTNLANDKFYVKRTTEYILPLK